MTTALLKTKLYVPPLRPNLVPRPRLIERLNQGLHRKLTLLSAPAGFGKTALLSAWCNDLRSGLGSISADVAWLSLDERDNDPVRFWTYVIAALQTVQEDVGVEAAIALGSPPVPPIEDLLAMLINQIDSLARHIVLVLDDYHLITAQPVHDGLTYLLAHLPDDAHLAIATRADPPLHVARLRGRGQLNELRQADLRFTGHEAGAFLNKAVGLSLSADDVAALTARTEGWISGLQMAAASLIGQDEPTRFIQAFTGSDRHVLDYLVEEVLHRQPDHIQTFLLRTAILDRLTGDLCDALLEPSGAPEAEDEPEPRPQADWEGQEILENLERANLFIVPLDNERQWYRYHRLFVDLLRKRLHHGPAGLVPALHRRASEWYERNGWTTEAIEHALAAQDLERAAELIEGAAETTLMHSEVATLLRWLGALPDEWVRSRPSLSLYHALALLLSGRSWEIVQQRLEDVDADLIPGQAASLRAFVAVFRGQMPHAAELSRQALQDLPQDDRFLRGLAAWLLSTSQLAAGDLETAGQTLFELSQVSQEHGNVLVAVGTLGNLARVRARQARLHEARAIYERAIALATDEQGRVLPIAGRVMLGLGDLLREWNDLDVAARYLEEGIQLTKRWREVAAFPGYISLARVRQSQGDTESARRAIREARRLAAEFDLTTWDDVLVAAYEARLWIARGEIGAAERWAAEQRSEASPGTAELGEEQEFIHQHIRKHEDIVLARLRIIQGCPDEALGLLEPLLSEMEGRGRQDWAIELQMLRALAYQAEGDTDRALDALGRALSLSEPAGYVRLFLDEGPPMKRLLGEAVARRIAAEYVRRLLAAFERETKDERAEAEAEQRLGVPPSLSWIEPLSERETQVLQLLATHLNSTEIAQELTIAPSTARSHIKHIYSKLGVHSRRGAVQRAEELGLI